MKEDIKGITVKKDENFSEWYTQVIQKADLSDYTKVSGCIVFKPYAYAIWEKIRDTVDAKIKKMGVKNVYFPLLIPEKLLNKEKEHVKGFNPEVAWVTHVGKRKLKERLAIRPTSETIMYDSYSKWIRSWRDLPLKLNQWNNVVRWEFKHAVPFLRTREFLWNEGHTVFSNKEDAEKECHEILDMYHGVAKDYLALFGVKGKKSEKEKFAGADYTLSIEYFMPNGKAIQGPDAHFDGQNFAKAFDIKFLDKDGKEKYVWQNTWAITTRMIGVLIAVHGDDKGLVLPPKIAPNKIVIVPILFKKDKDKVINYCKRLEKKFKKYDVIFDLRDYSSGWKYNDWELKGVPIRLEVGPNDIKKKQVVMYRRDNHKKEDVKLTSLDKKIQNTLDDIQDNLYNKSEEFFKKNLVEVDNTEDFEKAIKEHKFVKAYWDGDSDTEDKIKEKTGAKILNIPLEQPKKLKNNLYAPERKSKYMVYIAKSY